MLRFLARTLLGGTVMYLSGLFLWERYYAVERFLPPQFVDNQLASEVSRDLAIVWADIAGALVLAVLLTMVISWRDRSSVVDGLKTGAMVGIMIWGGVDLALYANFEFFSAAALITDPVIESLKFAAAGAAMGLVGRDPEPRD